MIKNSVYFAFAAKCGNVANIFRKRSLSLSVQKGKEDCNGNR